MECCVPGCTRRPVYQLHYTVPTPCGYGQEETTESCADPGHMAYVFVVPAGAWGLWVEELEQPRSE
ncbi:MAG: hypothetical protein AAGE52_01400 [Myxococcota bacterium]